MVFLNISFCSNHKRRIILYYKDKKIICVCPGWINTESVMNMNPNYLDNEMKRIGQNELLDKDYVAKKIFDIATGDVESGSVIEI